MLSFVHGRIKATKKMCQHFQLLVIRNYGKKKAKAIRRQNVDDSTYVCEKHFNEADIIQYWQSGSNGTTIVKVNK